MHDVVLFHVIALAVVVAGFGVLVALSRVLPPAPRAPTREVHGDADEARGAVRERVADAAFEALARRSGAFAIAASEAVLPLLADLAAEHGEVDWGRVVLALADRRPVGDGGDRAGRRLAESAGLTFLSPRRIPGGDAAEAAAYDRALRSAVPGLVFDVVVLGLDETLGPGGARRDAAAARVAPGRGGAYGLNADALNAARDLVVVAVGDGAAARAAAALADPTPLIAPHFLLDARAAALLRR